VAIILLAVSFSLTWLIKNYALKKQITDNPNERSSHTVPTPRLGGIAISLTWFLGLTAFYLLDYIPQNLFLALLSGILIAAVSMIDDILVLGFKVRLFIHFVAVILALYFLDGLRPFISFDIKLDIPWLVYPVVVVGMVWFINLFNFMDGLDGFASTEAISIALVLYIFTGSSLNLLLIASVLGFLYWNWPKAKIFMGDTGSTQLGFALIVLGIFYHNTLYFSILNWIMIAAPFWFDATYTLYKRWRNGEKISQAHRKHAYQRLTILGYSHLKVNFMLLFINAFILIMVLLYREISFLKIPVTTFTLLALLYLYHRIDKKVPF
jgi:Fuc2NAc and GlcNAc transferase